MIVGKVDGYGRPLVSVPLRHPSSGATLTVNAWIDTGFAGALLLLPDQIKALGLSSIGSTAAVLAGGTRVAFDTYPCQVEWFGVLMSVEVFEGTGKFPLLGLLLLDECKLVIDYPAQQVELTLVGKIREPK